MDGGLLQHAEEGNVMSPSENPWRKDQRYQEGFSKDKDKRFGKSWEGTAEHNDTSKESLAVKSVEISECRVSSF